MLRISLCLVFLRNSNNNPGLWEYPHMDEDRWWTRIQKLLQATMLDHLTAGSIQCLSWKSRLSNFPKLLHQNSLLFIGQFFFLTVRYKLLTGSRLHFLGHARMKEMPTDCTCDMSWSHGHMLMAGLSFHVCGPAWPQVMMLHHPHKFFQNQLLPSVCFCLYVNITSQCCILNRRDLCDKLFFGGKGSFNDTKAENITLPSLFSHEIRNSSRQLYVSLWQFVIKKKYIYIY